MLIFRCIEMNKQILNITELLIYNIYNDHQNEDIKLTTMSVTTSLISSLRSSSLLGTKVVTPRSVVLSRRLLSISYDPATKAALSSRANNVVPKTPASEIVSSFYTAINSNDLASARDFIAQDCVYEDLIFSSPFVGRTVSLFFLLFFFFRKRYLELMFFIKP